MVAAQNKHSCFGGSSSQSSMVSVVDITAVFRTNPGTYLGRSPINGQRIRNLQPADLAITIMSPEEKKHSDDESSYNDHLLPPPTNSYPSYSSILQIQQQPDRSILQIQEQHEIHVKNANQCHRTARILITMILVLISLCIATLRFWRLRIPLEEEDTIMLFDWIVVGAGPAGIIVATELARQRPHLNIVLLESGSTSQTKVLEQLERQRRDSCDDGNSIFFSSSSFFNEFDVPLLWSGAATSDQHHWGIELLGKAIGGSAIHNAMVYVRSLASDWDHVPGWEYDELLDAYVSLETYNSGNRRHRATGRSGRMTTSSPVLHDAIAPLFVQSASFAGYESVDSFNRNGSRSNTVGYYEFNIRNGVRDSVAAAFLGDDIPDNLIIETGATVTRVLLGLNTKAIGVEYVQNGIIGQCVLAKGGEVILSAGALLTPQLLHNSGFNFTYAVKDHPVVTVEFNVDSEMTADDALSSLYLLGYEMNQYRSAVELLSENATHNETETARLHLQLGALGTPGFTAGGFLRSPWADATGAPDIQLTVFPQQVEPHVIRNLKHRKQSPAMLVTVALLQPDAKYDLLPSQSNQPLILQTPVTSSDMMEPSQEKEWERIRSYRLPKVRIPNNGSKEDYLSDRDVKILAWGIQQVRKIQQTEPLSLHTGPEVYPATNDLHTHVRQNHLTNSHWMQSTPLGSSMVDERLRVSENVRIVDAGVLPMVPNGNIHSTVCVVASRAVQLILQDREDAAAG